MRAVVGGEVGVVPCDWLVSTAFSISMGWTGEHWSFVVEAYYENNRSVIATQRAFHTRFALGRNAHVTFSFGDT